MMAVGENQVIEEHFRVHKDMVIKYPKLTLMIARTTDVL